LLRFDEGGVEVGHCKAPARAEATPAQPALAHPQLHGAQVQAEVLRGLGGGEQGGGGEVGHIPRNSVRCGGWLRIQLVDGSRQSIQARYQTFAYCPASLGMFSIAMDNRTQDAGIHQQNRCVYCIFAAQLQGVLHNFINGSAKLILCHFV
jgi:hypothetical protein